MEEVESRELFRSQKMDRRMRVDKLVNFAYMTALLKDKKELSRVLQAAGILSEKEVLEDCFYYQIGKEQGWTGILYRIQDLKVTNSDGLTQIRP